MCYTNYIKAEFKEVFTMIDTKVEEIKRHMKAIFDILELEETESNKDTPSRVAKMYCNELFKNRDNYNIEELNSKMKLFDYTAKGIKQPITLSGIKFNSVCEHHWLPFMGIAEISYIPSDKVIGLSKIPRVVKYFSQKPQLQERLTDEIGDYLFDILKPEWLRISLTATHTCVMCRGAESECSTQTAYERFEGTYISPAFFKDCSKTTGGVTPV